MDYLGKQKTPDGERHVYSAWIASASDESVIIVEFELLNRDDVHAQFLVEQSAIDVNGHELNCSPTRN